MQPEQQKEIVKQLKQLKDSDSTFTFDDIAEVVKNILHTMDGDLSEASVKIYQELQGLANYINSAKMEIASIRPDAIKEEHIKKATDELDAVVGATEEATGTILDQVERIQTLAAKAPSPEKEEIFDAVTKIFEACNFQDITGQRITKVVTAINHIENTLERLLSTFGNIKDLLPDTPVPEQKAADELTGEELLNGPQSSSEAKNQDEIDALFESL